MDATGPRMLNDAVNAYETSELAVSWPLFVPEADSVYPYFDPQNPQLRSFCGTTAKPGLSARRNASCAKLRKLGFFNAPLGRRSFAVHHWQHSWVGFGYFDVDSVNATKLVADLRAADGEWVRGINYHESLAGDLTAADIDTWVPDRPVRIQHRSGIVWYLNSAAILARFMKSSRGR